MRLKLIAAAGWTLLLLLGTLLPATWMPESLPSDDDFSIPHMDKIAHVVLFGGFGFLWTAVAGPRGRTWPILAGGVLLAIGTELGQGLPFIGRTTDASDLLADLVGLGLGVALLLWIGPMVRSKWMVSESLLVERGARELE